VKFANTKFKKIYPSVGVGRDSSVGIATRYGLDDPGIESRWGARFFAAVQTGSGAHLSLLYNGYRVSLRGVKRPGCAVDHPPPSSARVKERVELYLYSPSGPSWHVLGRTLPLLYLPIKLCFLMRMDWRKKVTRLAFRSRCVDVPKDANE
jgi:hypothetical protein